MILNLLSLKKKQKLLKLAFGCNLIRFSLGSLEVNYKFIFNIWKRNI